MLNGKSTHLMREIHSEKVNVLFSRCLLWFYNLNALGETSVDDKKKSAETR